MIFPQNAVAQFLNFLLTIKSNTMAAKLKATTKQTTHSYNAFMQHHKKSTKGKFSTHKKIIQKSVICNFVIQNSEYLFIFI